MTQAKHTAGPWMVSHRGTSIVCTNEKIGGEAKLFDVRGWGYLTGSGHGGLGLDEGTATQIQLANANLAAAAPDMLEALKAEQAADNAFSEAEELSERADAEGWLNEPTGSMHVTEAWTRATAMRAKAADIRKAAIAKAEGRT